MCSDKNHRWMPSLFRDPHKTHAGTHTHKSHASHTSHVTHHITHHIFHTRHTLHTSNIARRITSQLNVVRTRLGQPLSSQVHQVAHATGAAVLHCNL